MKNTSEQIAMLKSLLDQGSISEKEYEEMLGIALQTEAESVQHVEEEDTLVEPKVSPEEVRVEKAIPIVQKPELRPSSALPILGVFVVLFLIGTILFASLWMQSSQERDAVHWDAQQDKSRLEKEILEKDQKINDLEGRIELLATIQPLFASNLSFSNSDGAGESTNANGEKCFRYNSVRYIYTTLNIDCLKAGSYTLEKRMYDPNGVMSRSDGYSTRTATTGKTVDLSKGTNYVDLEGWGNESGGTYDRGRNRVEIWCQGRLLIKGYFYVN